MKSKSMALMKDAKISKTNTYVQNSPALGPNFLNNYIQAPLRTTVQTDKHVNQKQKSQQIQSH